MNDNYDRATISEQRSSLTRRQILKAGAGALAGLTLPDLLSSAACADACGPDPILDPKKIDRWFYHAAMAGTIRQGNNPLELYPGESVFNRMVQDIQLGNSDKDYIYLLGWWLTDSFALQAANNNTTVQRLLKAASDKKVQVRAMVWWPSWVFSRRHKALTNEVVGRINALANGAAIRDDRTRVAGSHHQKILIVYAQGRLIAYCGGVDINPDRLHPRGIGPNKEGDTSGAPFQDVQCRIEGPSAWDLLQLFIQRWSDHPENGRKDIATKGALRGISTKVPVAIIGATNWIQIGRTYGSGADYQFAPAGERSAAGMILRAIQNAEETIYVEDQYFFGTGPIRADGNADRLLTTLQATLKKPDFRRMIVLIPRGDIVDLYERNYRRQQFIKALKAAGGDKIKVFDFKPGKIPPGDRYSYVHSKTWVFDDQYAIIGSANCNRRSFTHDSEVVAGICDQGDGRSLWLPHRLRAGLWASHLNVDRSKVCLWADGEKIWLNPPPNARFEPFDENANIEDSTVKNFDEYWNTTADPDGTPGP